MAIDHETPTRRMHGNMANRLRREFCGEQQSYLWGEKRMVVPQLLPVVFGDGKQIIAIRPIVTRLSHYVVAVDSSWTLNVPWRPWKATIRDHLPKIYEELENWFGMCKCEECRDLDEESVDCPHKCWPRPCFQIGTEWWGLR